MESRNHCLVVAVVVESVVVVAMVLMVVDAAVNLFLCRRIHSFWFEVIDKIIWCYG
jgi:hypothetical protein